LDSFMPGLRVEEPEWVHTRSPGAEPEGPPEGPIDVDELREAIIDNLVLINDPEIPVNIYDLGLIYRLDVTPDGDVHVLMTLTAPNCPVAGSMPPLVEKGVMQVPGVRTCHVELTWEPPWSPDKASEDAQIALGF
jgi:FeS assembly SUF system protein